MSNLSNEKSNQNISNGFHLDCQLCKDISPFATLAQFTIHLRTYHCNIHNGSYICQYGNDNICDISHISNTENEYSEHVSYSHGKHFNESIKKDKWTLSDSNINLPAILNDPRYGRRDKQIDIFSRTWEVTFEKGIIYPSPYVHSTEITKLDFSSYIHRISKYKKKKINSRENIHHNISTSSSINNIPKIFLDADFELSKLETFSEVFPEVFTNNPSSDNKRQSKLSLYLDVVEVRIASQISQRSQTFFDAMHSQDVIQRNMADTKHCISVMRTDIRQLDDKMVKKPLKLLKLCQCRANLMKMLLKLQMMSALHQTQSTIQVHLATNEFAGACDLISSAKLQLRRDYAGLHCFRYLGSQLQEMHSMIRSMMSVDFSKCVAADLNRLPTSRLADRETPPTNANDSDLSIDTNGHSTEQSSSNATNATTTNCSDDNTTDEDICDSKEFMEYEEKIMAIVTGLVRQKDYNFISSYETEVVLCMKTIFKHVVFNAIADLQEDDNKTPTDMISELNIDKCVVLLRTLFSRIIIVLKRVKYICIRIADLDTEDDDDADDNEENVESENRLIESLAAMLRNICDKANRDSTTIVAKALDTCSDNRTFIKLSKLIDSFAEKSSMICGQKKSKSPLRSTLQLHVEKYINRFDEEKRNKLAFVLNNERWKQVDTPFRIQQFADILQSNDIIVLSKNAQDKDDKYEYLTLYDEKYAVIGTSLILLELTMEYSQCLNDFPCASNSILTKLINIFKFFNSRTCQLILGAGVLNFKILKGVSVKNLAITLRCLELTVAYIPRVRLHFMPKVSPPPPPPPASTTTSGEDATPTAVVPPICGQTSTSSNRVSREFKRVTDDYLEHIENLRCKFHDMLDCMLLGYLQLWEAKAPVPSDSFREIVRKLSKLHSDVFNLWPITSVQALFKYANCSFCQNLIVQLKKLGVRNDRGPQHSLVLTDIRYYVTNIGVLSGLGELSFKNTEEVWQSI